MAGTLAGVRLPHEPGAGDQPLRRAPIVPVERRVA